MRLSFCLRLWYNKCIKEIMKGLTYESLEKSWNPYVEWFDAW